MKKENLLSKAEMKKVMGGNNPVDSTQCEIVGGYCRSGTEDCKEGYKPDPAADCPGCCIPK